MADAATQELSRAGLPGGPGAAPPSSRWWTQPGRRWVVWLLPAVALTLFFTLYPVFEAVRLSFFSWRGFGDQRFIGFDNYAELLGDPVGRTALWNTMLFAVLTAVGTVVVGGAVAIALDRHIPMSTFFKNVIFLPVILPVVFTGLVWVYGMDANFGWLNRMLGAISPQLQQAWLADPDIAMYSIIGMTILQFAGFPMMVIMAALGDVTREVHEAATVDGVTELQRVRYVTLPIIKDVILTILLLQLLYGFKVFDQVFVMTRGGPGRATEVMSTYVQRQAFTLQQFGLGAAAGVVTSIVVVALSMIYQSLSGTRRMSRAG
jgi:ABC-type sugar transport system permease subunit